MSREEPAFLKNLIGTLVTIRGEVSCHEDLVIEGKVEGSVHAQDHQVTIGGDVEGEVRARRIVISGNVCGNVFASESLDLQTGSRLDGDATTPRIAMDEGALPHGKLHMGGTAADPPVLGSERDAPRRDPKRSAPARHATTSLRDELHPLASAPPIR